MNGTSKVDSFHTIVVGGGQAGLVVGYHLKQKNIPFVILDAGKRVGDAWRNRWDSLRLFSPSFWNHLDGHPAPGPRSSFPTKDETADWLEEYARKYDLPVRLGVRVDKISKEGERYVLKAGDRTYEAENVVVAMSSYQVPRVPECTKEIDASIVQLHSTQYKNPSQLKPGAVVVVGAANSGAEIALDCAKAGHTTYLAGRHPGHIPFRIEGFLARMLMMRVVKFAGHKVLTVNTPPGKKMRKKMLSSGAPLVRTKPKDLEAAGVKRTGRVEGAEGGKPKLDDGQVLDVTNIIWCTGFTPGFSKWIDLPIFEENGMPEHDRGVIAKAPGLYFVGLLYLYAMSSAFLLGVSRDAEYTVNHLAKRTANEQPQAGQQAAAR